jgi:Protein of unknown function (DUF1552)
MFMKHGRTSSFIPRRAALAGIGASAAGMLLRPLFASAEGASPTRLLIVHRPCGTRPEVFFPAVGDAKNFSLDFSGNVGGVMIPSITKPFTPLIPDMVLLNGITCPRDQGWAGDQHAAAMITMMTGKRFMALPGTTDLKTDSNAKTIVAVDKSIDQLLLGTPAANLGGRPVGSIQSTAYRPSSVSLPAFRVLSYGGSNAPLFPESRPATLFDQIFGSATAELSPEALARLRTQNKSILDFVNGDLTRLRSHVPASQQPKLDAHLAAIQTLEKAVGSSGVSPGASCGKPKQVALPAASGGVSADEAQHLANAQNQLGIISAAFQCDLTRVATFSFAHGNSYLEFSHIIQGENLAGGGHHDISHNTGAGLSQARIDRFYCEALATFLTQMKAIPDGAGNMLDNTLVVFFNECSDGNGHDIHNMPVVMFGGKSLKLNTGQHMKFNGRYMNDVWSAVAGAFGAPTTFGDAAFSKGPVPGLFG